MSEAAPPDEESRARSPSARPVSRRWLAAGVGVFVLAAGVAIAAAWSEITLEWGRLRGDVAGYPWRLRPLLLAVACLCAVAALLVTGALWTHLFRAAGGRSRVAEGTAAWLGSNLGRYLPGKVWQLTSIAAYARARGEPGAAAFVVSLALQAVILGTGVALAVAITGGRGLGLGGPWTLAASAVLLAVAVSPPALRGLVRLGARLMREPVPEGVTRLSAAPLVVAGLVGVAVWVLYGLGFWALCAGLVSPAPISWLEAVGVFAGGYVAGYIVLLAPGGLVVREGAIAALLGSIATIPLAPASAVALAARAWTSLAELLAFALAAGVGMRSPGAEK